MSALAHTTTLAAFEFKGLVRCRWLTVAAIVLAAATAATTIAGMRSFAALGLAGAGAAIDGLVHVTLLLPPLVGLLLGASGLARDREQGMLGMFAAQPVFRPLLPLAGFAGASAAVWTVVSLGLGVGMLLLSPAMTLRDLAALGLVLVVGLAAAASAVAIGVLLASVASTYQQATAAAAAVWLLLALGLDLLLAGVAPGLRLGSKGLLAVVVINPLDAARVLALLVLDGAAALGPFGAYLTGTFGRTGATWLLSGVVVGWTVVPLMIAGVITARRDV